MSRMHTRPSAPMLRMALAPILSLTLLVGLLVTLNLARVCGLASAQGPPVRYVDGVHGADSGDCLASPCRTIGYALARANNGDIVRVAGGTYLESLTLDKPVDLLGAGAEGTIITAVPGQRVLTVTGASITNSTIISGFTFTGGNPAADVGGGVLILGSAPTIQNNRIISNTAGAQGGGLYLLDSTGLILTNNTVGYNRAATKREGGGLYFNNSPSATLTANTIVGNIAWRGGGLYLIGSPGAVLAKNTIISNTAGYSMSTKHGGGLYAVQSDHMTLNDNLVDGNLAWNNGGGLCFQACADIELNRNLIRNNRSGSGAGLFFLTSTDVTLTNNVIADNQANALGSGLYISSSALKMLHNTIARNSGGAGSGIHVASEGSNFSAVALTNTIVVSHTVGVTVTAGNTASLNGVLWYDNTSKVGGMGTITVSNECTGTPGFLASDGYHVGHTSAAIERGVNGGVTTDIDGDPRPIDGDLDGVAIADIGADEFNPYQIRLYLPIVMKDWQ